MALPDFPNLKNEISSLLNEIVRDAQLSRMQPFDLSPRSTIREGSERDISTVDGQIKPLEIASFKVEHSFQKTSLGSMSHEDIVLEMMKIGAEFGGQVSKQFLTNLSREIEAAGRVHRVRDRELTVDDYLEMLTSIEIGFEEDGSPRIPQIVAHPDSGLRERLQKIMAEPGFRERFAQLIEIKRGEWNARESHRKLVD